MNTRSSNYTGRAARSLESAFGPYARGPIQAPDEPMPTADKVVLIVSACAFGGVIVMHLIGWLV